MTKPTSDVLRAAIGQRAVDHEGQQVGTIADFYLDADTDEPEWVLVVLEGVVATRTFVPLANATLTSEDIRIAFDRARLQSAPRFAAGEELSEADERQLYEHYGLGYSAGSSDTTLFEGAGLTTADAGAAPATAATPVAEPVRVDEVVASTTAPAAGTAATGTPAPPRQPPKLVRLSALAGAAEATTSGNGGPVVGSAPDGSAVADSAPVAPPGPAEPPLAADGPAIEQGEVPVEVPPAAEGSVADGLAASTAPGNSPVPEPSAAAADGPGVVTSDEAQPTVAPPVGPNPQPGGTKRRLAVGVLGALGAAAALGVLVVRRRRAAASKRGLARRLVAVAVKPARRRRGLFG